ncbi:GNAT family N-acetyltransferase [Herbaspirillum autotrophicum]|uniref:GNAT family N-acetyltransferase n=1 Tax=Herbaspirillum autotrophicum TaxID=180195 RepID=UPI00067B7901|nr:GNAT family N-acetyltransferase [Herbaspirillum autotrophicum]
MPSLHIATARPAQAGHISALINALAGYFVPDPTHDSAAAFLASVTPAAISALIDNPACRYYVASHGGNPALAGVIALRQLPARHHVHHLFVAPELHGQGVARTLWQHARDAAGNDGHAGGFSVNSSVFAVPMYERLGFIATGPEAEKNGICFVPMQYDGR